MPLPPAADLAALPRPQGSLRRRCIAVFCTFATVGVGLGTWITRTPELRDTLGASTSEMGFILFGMAVGSMTGVLRAGSLVRRVGTRSVVALGLALIIAGLTAIALAGAVSSPISAFLGLASFGIGMGSIDIAINLEGVNIERILGRAILPALHGSASLGTGAGAAVGIVAHAQQVPLAAHLLLTSVLTLVSGMCIVAWLPGGFGRQPGRRSRAHRASSVGAGSPLRERRMVLIGAVVLGMALAEGAGNDWLPLLMVDGHGYAEHQSSLVFAIFASCMGFGRLTGSPLVDRFGRSQVVRSSGLLCIAGIAVVILAEHAVVAGIAVAIWGLGASLGFPLAVSAANDGDGDRQPHVTAIARTGYLAFLMGPPALGLLGEAFGLRNAMVPVVLVVVLAVVSAGATTDLRGVSAPRSSRREEGRPT